ncbi:hypothetical protein ABT010_18795 [Streptomyces sp. NPDC002668]|uniref:hypothetical protein n=1 Tax=Streptomyces sp. NPDC002668 TaxID=3154422 RepID=UPI00332C2774
MTTKSAPEPVGVFVPQLPGHGLAFARHAAVGPALRTGLGARRPALSPSARSAPDTTPSTERASR